MSDENEDLGNLQYAATHIFFPPKLPQKSDLNMKKEHAICALVHQIAQMYTSYLPFSKRAQWECITNMLENLARSQEFAELDDGFISNKMAQMCSGSMLFDVSYKMILKELPLQTFSLSPYVLRTPAL